MSFDSYGLILSLPVAQRRKKGIYCLLGLLFLIWWGAEAFGS